MTTPLHPFDEATQLVGDAGRYQGHTSPHYGNMVGPFGGTTVATLLRAVLQHPALQGEPVAVTANFAAPIADGAFEVTSRAVRTSRSTQHWAMELSQGGQVAASATAVCAVRRETWRSTEASMPVAPAPDDVPAVGRVPGMPVWIAAYDLRLVRGGMPGLPQREAPREPADSESLLWVRDAQPRPLDALSLVAMSDVFFPRSFVRRRKFLAAGTVSITTYLHADAALYAAQSDRPLLGHCRALAFGGGFFDQTAELWSPEGRLLATSCQIVYSKE